MPSAMLLRPLFLQLTNISLGEITELRDFLTTAQSHLRTIERAIEPEDGLQPQSQENSYQYNYTAREQGAAASIENINHARADTAGEADTSLNNDNMDLF
jgi:hypothetical protein